MMSDQLEMIDTVEPPLSQWSGVLAVNVALRRASPDSAGGASRAEMRRQLLAEAVSYTESLAEKAKRASVDLPTPDASPEPDAPIVMTGHQPVAYHAGLLLKEELLNAIAADAGAAAVSVTIDTDEGDGGRIVWPLVEHGALTLKVAAIASTTGGVFREHRVADGATVRRAFDEISRDLRISGLGHMEKSASQAGTIYEALAGEPLSEAHSIVRRVLRGHTHLEAPLSRVMALPEARRFIGAIMGHAQEVHRLYNGCLTAYRAEHKIKNAANPFPNLRAEGGEIELPVWVLSASGRRPLWVKPGETASVAKEEIVVPKGSFVTLLLRGLCSDLFIHGLGGARYDRFVDAFGAAYLGESLPAFVVASRTRYVFAQRVQELRSLLLLKSRIKEMISHPELFLGQGLFSVEEERYLAQASRERKELLGGLGGASMEERKPITECLNGLNRRLRAYVEQTDLSRRLHRPECSEAMLAHWSNRELPFFLE